MRQTQWHAPAQSPGADDIATAVPTPAVPGSRGAGKLRGITQSRLTDGFRALRVRNYRLFFYGQAISMSGSWMQTTAQAWLVLQLTTSPFALGLVTTLQFLPMTLLSLVGGVIADCVPKHCLLLLTQSAAMLLAAIFGLLCMLGVGGAVLYQRATAERQT